MIIRSPLDTDQYKITMGEAVLFGRYAGISYSDVNTHYQFINRGGTKFPPGFAECLKQEVRLMQELSLTSEEKEWLLANCLFLKPAFIDWFQHYRFNADEVDIRQDGGDLYVSIAGPWYRTIFWEVSLLALISELYYRETDKYADVNWTDRAIAKAVNLGKNGCYTADFGTRRRFSYAVQDHLVGLMKQHCPTFTGTSNIHLAMKHGVKPIGTHAHEFFMFHAALFGYRLANYHALQAWCDEYQGDLGIALTDTFTTQVFWRDFNSVFTRLFSGVRHDSSEPIKFAQSAIDHYEQTNVDPLTKTIVFSDSLTDVEAVRIKKWCEGKIKCAFGIGTFLSNDCGHTPLNMVIKMTGVEYNGRYIPTVKLSDVPGKHTGDSQEVEICKKVLGITND